MYIVQCVQVQECWSSRPRSKQHNQVCDLRLPNQLQLIITYMIKYCVLKILLLSWAHLESMTPSSLNFSWKISRMEVLPKFFCEILRHFFYRVSLALSKVLPCTLDKGVLTYLLEMVSEGKKEFNWKPSYNCSFGCQRKFWNKPISGGLLWPQTSQIKMRITVVNTVVLNLLHSLSSLVVINSN